MTKEQAIQSATQVAHSEGVTMVVTFNPYADEFRDADKFGYFPEGAQHIFKYEKVIETIRP